MTGGRYIALILALLLVVSGMVCAQDFPVLHYTMENGVPSNKVYSAYRDSKGYMWIATDKGIARYNGIKFETFTTFNGLPDNEVFFFQEDNAGRIWLATYNGELCYYKDDTFHTAANTPYLKLPFKTSFINRIELEKDSSITVVFWKEPKFINIKNGKISVINLSRTILCDYGNKVLEREKKGINRYRLICDGDILEVDTLGRVLTTATLPVANPEQQGQQYWNVSFTQNQDFIISEHYLFDKEGEVVRGLDDTFLKKNIVYIIYHNSLGYLFGTNNGIVLNGNTRLLQGYPVSCITQDKAGNYWATTLEGGLFIYDKYFTDNRVYKDVYKGKIEYAKAQKGHLYFTARDNNLYELANGKTKRLFNYSHYVSEESKQANNHFYLIDSSFRCFYFNDKGGVVIEDLLATALRTKNINAQQLYPNALRSAIAVGDTLYINADHKVLATNIAGYQQGMPLKFAQLSDGANEKIFGFAKAPDNSIWYATMNNVYKVVKGVGVVQTEFNKSPFLFFGFFGDYLVGYTHTDKFFICRNYNSKAELTEVPEQNCIWDKFYPLDSDHVLISTNNFYRLLTLSSQEIRIVGHLHAPLQAEAVCSDGEHIYFFKNGTITSIALDRFLALPDPPKLFFTYLRAGHVSYHIEREVQIPFKESKNISIDFSALSFSGSNMLYYYSVSKDEDNWQPLRSEEINLVNPSPGYYTIKIKAKTLSSRFSAPVVFTLYVAQPFWTTWWFITLCAWGLIALIWGLMRYRLLAEMRKKETHYQTEIKFMKSEYKAMNALMNPHFIFNTLNNVQSLVNANDKAAANEYLRIFADLIRQNMHNISKELIPLQKEVELVSNYLSLEQLRFEDKLTYNINVEDGLDLSEIMIPPLLIQPLVENSIKHGILPLKKKKGVIKLEIFEQDGALHIEVKDNGIGISDKAKQEDSSHESYGLSNIRKRIDQLGIMQNKNITFGIEEIIEKPSLQSWTVVTIIIPDID